MPRVLFTTSYVGVVLWTREYVVKRLGGSQEYNYSSFRGKPCFRAGSLQGHYVLCRNDRSGPLSCAYALSVFETKAVDMHCVIGCMIPGKV